MNLLRATMTELGLSARAHDKILRVARTIADLDASAGRRAAPANECRGEGRRNEAPIRPGARERSSELSDAGSADVDVR